MPKATIFLRVLMQQSEGNQRWASPIHFIPLILTFSHPGEGTLVRCVSVILNCGI